MVRCRMTITPAKLDCSLPKVSSNSAALYAVTNVIAGRQRPNQGNGHGDFFTNNTLDSSFPSGHATLQFSMSSVLAHEYPSLGSKILWYGLGTAVAASRVVGREHFPSDVIMGGTLGYLVGTHIYHAHSSARDPKRQALSRQKLTLPFTLLSYWAPEICHVERGLHVRIETPPQPLLSSGRTIVFIVTTTPNLTSSCALATMYRCPDHKCHTPDPPYPTPTNPASALDHGLQSDKGCSEPVLSADMH